MTPTMMSISEEEKLDRGGEEDEEDEEEESDVKIDAACRVSMPVT